MHSSAATTIDGSDVGLVLYGQPGPFAATPAAAEMQHVVPELQRTPP